MRYGLSPVVTVWDFMIIQLILTPFCDTGKVVSDILISMKSYLRVDNPGEAIVLKALTKCIFIQ